MTDPIAIVGLLVTVGQILSALHEYGKSVTQARKDIADLSTELLVLQGVLRQIEKRGLTNSSVVSTHAEGDPRRVLESAAHSLNLLVRKLDAPTSGFKRFAQYTTWPLDKKDVAEQMTRFERLKSLLILVFLTEATDDISEAVQSLKVTLVQDLNRVDNILTQQMDSDLVNWLAPLSPEPRHLRFSAEREPETRKWFLDGPFRSWLTGSEQNTMCLTGKSGTGKTTLFSFAVDTLVEECRVEQTWISAYWYCSFTEVASQQPSNILGSFICQLAHHDPTFLSDARSVYESSRYSSHRTPMSIQQMEDSICNHLLIYERVYFLVDAINESQEKEGIMKSLFRLTQRCKNLRLLISTIGDAPRDESTTNRSLMTIRFEPKGSQNDIAAMVENALVSRPGLRGLSEKLKQEVRDAFSKQADGSFRWAYLSLDNLARKNTPRQVRAALQGLPVSLGDIYAEILCRIPEDTKVLAQRALLWLVFARRPLTLLELNEAIVMEDDQTDIDEDDRICRETAVLETCHGLLDCYNGVVSLAHSSVETFLTKTETMPHEAASFGLDIAEGDRTLMRVCLQYLSMKPFASGYRRDDKELLQTLREYPLLDYAAQSWAVHARRCELRQNDKDAIMRFLRTARQPRGGNHSMWVHALSPATDPVDLRSLSTTHPLYYAASFGLYRIVETILQEDPDMDINAQGGRYGSHPLFVACWREHYDIAHLLLDAGADATLEDEASGFTASTLVSQWGKNNSETRKLLAHIDDITKASAEVEQLLSSTNDDPIRCTDDQSNNEQLAMPSKEIFGVKPITS